MGMTNTRWWQYLQGLMGPQTQLEAAKHIGISKSNITRWKNGARADPEFVVKVARAYHTNVLEALVEAEFITEQEANLRWVETGGLKLAEATNEQLLDEIMRRSDPQARYLFGNEGDEETIGLAPHLTPVSGAHASLHDEDDGTVMEWDDSIPHAADSSPDEQAEREKRGEDLID